MPKPMNARLFLDNLAHHKPTDPKLPLEYAQALGEELRLANQTPDDLTLVLAHLKEFDAPAQQHLSFFFDPRLNPVMQHSIMNPKRAYDPVFNLKPEFFQNDEGKFISEQVASIYPEVAALLKRSREQGDLQDFLNASRLLHQLGNAIADIYVPLSRVDVLCQHIDLRKMVYQKALYLCVRASTQVAEDVTEDIDELKRCIHETEHLERYTLAAVRAKKSKVPNPHERRGFINTDIFDRTLLEGRLPYGTFAKLITNAAQEQGLDRSTIITDPVRFKTSQQLSVWLDTHGIVDPSTQNWIISAWVAEAHHYPDYGTNAENAFLRLIHSSMRRVTTSSLPKFFEADLFQIAEQFEDNQHPEFPKMNVGIALAVALFAFEAGFSPQVVMPILANKLLAEPGFALFEGILSPEDQQNAKANVCHNALVHYLRARMELFRICGNSSDTSILSYQATCEVKKAADLLETVPVNTAGEQESLRILRISLYDMALTTCPRIPGTFSMALEMKHKLLQLAAEPNRLPDDPTPNDAAPESSPTPAGNAPPPPNKSHLCQSIVAGALVASTNMIPMTAMSSILLTTNTVFRA